ncbi:uncharacterized protein LOC130818480 [Amaranthus tricolor]|uniref:uncharacterized protein LOC130818480 n=1 Tax=Amaranthus tricolor TaxID=29722 RepID=UPI00258460D6|nr:uncharacterized protein LOC130818480 [Amaranthus tricolor]
MRQRRWLELIKDYETEILYHPGKANKVADALSRRPHGGIHFMRNLPRELWLELQKKFREQSMIEVQEKAMCSVDAELRNDILHEAHARSYSVHWGRDKMIKSKRKKEVGLTQPLDIPDWKWDSISMDFVVAKIYVQEIVKLHRVPRIINSDKDSKFLSHFWKELQEAFGTKLSLSTDFHPATDGRIEKTI